VSAARDPWAPTPREVVELSLATHGRAALSTVYDAANLLGVADQPLRLAIRRLSEAGIVEQTGRGRAGSLRSTARGRRRALLAEAYWDFALRQDAGEPGWDGLWHLLAFSVPESHRALRDALRAALSRLGAAPLTPGLFVSPHDLSAALEAEHDGGVGGYLTTATARSVQHAGRPLADVVGDLWPLGALRDAYTDLLGVMDRWSGPATRGGPAAALAGYVAVHAALERAMGPDPLLPPELLPPDWPGRCARDRVRRDWLAPA
jgi:phenylacetic acid degradation operon negative regulatory protein